MKLTKLFFFSPVGITDGLLSQKMKTHSNNIRNLGVRCTLIALQIFRSAAGQRWMNCPKVTEYLLLIWDAVAFVHAHMRNFGG
jgi:hypothetical protein